VTIVIACMYQGFEAFLITISKAYCTLNLDLRFTLVLGVSFTLGCIEERRTFQNPRTYNQGYLHE